MADAESPQPTETEHSYLDVSPGGPRAWVLAVGAFFIVLAIAVIFYGLDALNRASSVTPSPDPLVLTEVAAATLGPEEIDSRPSPSPVAITSTPSPTVIAAVEPPTYTVKQGDSLIVIAQQLNVNSRDMATLNQISGETIYPGQILLVPPTVTPWPETGPFPHIISQGETFISIAALYSVTVDEIKNLNGTTSDNIFVGQQILIPGSGVRPPTPTPTPTPWQPAVITGELELVYSLTTVKGHFNLHIPPNTRAAALNETAQVARLVENALGYSQTVLRRRFAGRFAVYVGGTPFDAPYTPRRGYSLPEENQLWLLYDGSGTPTERLYFTTYALTHLIAAQTLGDAASPLLAEGLAVYAGGQALVGEGAPERSYLQPLDFCAAYQAAGRLPRVSRTLTFEGHLGYWDQYMAAGCFVGHLIETEGSTAFAQVYLDGDYHAAYGRTLNQLETEWMATLQNATDEQLLDPEELARVSAAIDDAYHRLWTDFEGTPDQFAAYHRLDRARLSMLHGRLGTAEEHLEVFETLLESE